MGSWPIIAIRIVGVACILLAVAGYGYSYISFMASKELPLDSDTPYFKISYFIMFSVCLLFYTLLLIIGGQFLMLILKYKSIFTLLLSIEILYILSIGLIALVDNQQVVMSIATAVGIANGGLMFQVLTGFIVWAPALLYFASKKLR